MATTITTHVCLVLDLSGSMQAVHDDALGGVNGYITAAKQDRALYKSRFSLITFNSKSVDTKRGQGPLINPRLGRLQVINSRRESEVVPTRETKRMNLRRARPTNFERFAEPGGCG